MNNDINIPKEAVEAAARAYREQQAELGYPKWEDLSEDGREWRRGYMRAALEAASPHLRAAAWEFGIFRTGAEEGDAPLMNQTYATRERAAVQLGRYRDGEAWLEVRSRTVTPWTEAK